jgi:hypothetical protein
MSLLITDKNINQVLAFVKSREDIFNQRNNVDFLLTFDGEKWCLYDTLRGVSMNSFYAHKEGGNKK